MILMILEKEIIGEYNEMDKTLVNYDEETEYVSPDYELEEAKLRLRKRIIETSSPIK